MRYVLALDQGTRVPAPSCSTSAGARASAQKEFRQHFPQPGWVEHDALEILRTQLACARAALKKAKLAPSASPRSGSPISARPRGVGPAHGSARPPRHRLAGPAHAARCDALKREGLDKAVQAKTGLIVDPYFSATKIEWLLDNIAGLRSRAERGELAFGTVDTWLAWHLSGGELHVTDPSNASRTMLYDIHRGEWDEELLRIFRVPRSLLPESYPPPRSTARRPRRCSAQRFPSRASPAISRPRSSARPATTPAWRRTPTAPDAFSFSTRAIRQSRRATA